MSIELILSAVLIPYVIYLEARLMDMTKQISNKTSHEDVKSIIDMKQEAVITKIDNLKEDIQELKEQLKEISGKL